MRETEIPVTFPASGKTVYVLGETRVGEAAAVAGIVLEMPCGGTGTCGKCRVQLPDEASPPTPAESAALSADELAQGYRLACQSPVRGPTTVVVPAASLPAAYHKILFAAEDFALGTPDPTIRKLYAELPPPGRDDDAADLARLQRAVGPVRADLDLLRQLPALLRQADFRGTAVVADGWLLDFEPGDTAGESFAVAVDVGTTTLVAALLDTAGGQPRQVAARLNPQTRLGDDVLSRILYARKPGGLDELQQTLVAALDEMIEELVRQAGIQRRQVYEITFSGNTTMQQLLCGIDSRHLGEVPFVPVVGRSLTIPARELGLRIHPRGLAYVMPVIGGFVGGDTVAGLLATGLDESPGTRLLVDIGTNGEIVLWAGGKLTAASTAAGPAFEGARISQGMRGSTGAIEKVVVDGRLRLNVIGNVPPLGICGSALIDLAAELLGHGLLSPEGRLCRPGEVPADVPPDLAGRVLWQEKQPAFCVATAEETGHGKPILLTQRDLRELQLATGAIRAGITLLLARAGLEPADLEEIFVAGGFGNFIRRSNAQRIGLLPHGVASHRIRYRGNTSLAGAQLVAISGRARAAAEELARRTEHVDLSRDPRFTMTFAEAMIFPGDEGEGT